MKPLLAAIFLLPLSLLACQSDGTGSTKGNINRDDPKSLPTIRMYNSSLGKGDYLVEIRPSGEITVQEHVGTTEGNVRRSVMQLSPEQVDLVQKTFKGWKRLPTDYPGDWANLVEITYDGYTIRAHDLEQTPRAFTDAMAVVQNLAIAAKKATAATQSAGN